MIDYNRIIMELNEEKENCNTRYGGQVPAYYQQEIRTAICALLKCQDSLKDLEHHFDTDHGDSYKVDELLKMLRHETNENETHYGAHLTHWIGDAKPLTIDAGGISALIIYYSNHDTEH